MPRLLVRTTQSKPAEMTVSVNGKPWHLVASIVDTSPHDRVFTVTTTPGGETVVQFGDRVNGARPPAGGSIALSYRSGAGGQHAEVSVRLHRTASDPTLDQALWVATRNRTRGLSFEFYNRHPRRPHASLLSPRQIIGIGRILAGLTLIPATVPSNCGPVQPRPGRVRQRTVAGMDGNDPWAYRTVIVTGVQGPVDEFATSI